MTDKTKESRSLIFYEGGKSMSMSVGSVNNVYATYSTQKTRQNSQISKTEVNQEDYIKELQEKNPQINIAAGHPDRNAKVVNYTGRTDVRIAPELLNKMMENPQIAAKYENMLSKIPALDRWADSMIKSMTGSEVKYRQVWIDEDGNMGSMCITGPSEAQKKENEDKKIEEKKEYEKILAERRKQKKEYEEWLEGKREDMPVVRTDISDMVKYTMFNKYI